MRRLLVIALVLFVGSLPASGFDVSVMQDRDELVHREIPSDPKLPKYDNPAKIDLEDGKLCIRFQGLFRGTGEDKDWIAFVFIERPENDMRLSLDESEGFDGKGERLNDWGNWYVGRERTREREIIGAITMPVIKWLRVPASEYGEFPTIARVNFAFNGQWYQFRNIRTEEWQVWESLKQELGL